MRLLLLCSVASASFVDRCLSFEPEKHVASTRKLLEHVTAGTLQLDTGSCNRETQAVEAEMCRVALQIPTSNRSRISLELWLPEQWGGRLLATGNGGVDGCIKYEDLAYGTANGFATVGTNNGHDGPTGVEFLGNPDVVEDFSYRALHVGTVAAKTLVESFYGAGANRSYYLGCSLGGRMGIGAAERFPDDYDGIVAGSPAVDFNNLYGWRASFFPITGGPESADYIPIDTWTGLIHDEVMRQCDGIDGVEDGIIEVVDKCHFDPSTLLGNGLNAQQIRQVEQVYAEYRYPDGTLIFPRMNPGGEVKAAQGLLAGKPFGSSVEWFRYVVRGADWDPANYTVEDVGLAEAMNPFGIKTFPKSLPGFKQRGKMMTYHGGQDQQITSLNTERLWDQMASEDAQLADYFRFFRISGMGHCSGGPGAWALGQGGNARAPFDAEHNVLAAVVDWVETGTAPETMTGTKFVEDDASKGVDYQRVHCRYPMQQTYVGGDAKETASWMCM